MISRYTGSVRAPAKEYRELLKPCGKPIEKLALAARRTILDEAPEANEFIYELYTIAAHFSFTDRPSDAFVFTTTHAKWINLGFNFGAALPDPLRLLEGEGKWIRHVRISKPEDLDQPGVRDLIRAAIAEAEKPAGKIAKAKTVVRRKTSGATGSLKTHPSKRG